MAARKTKSTKKASTAKHTKVTLRSKKRAAKPAAGAPSAKPELTAAVSRVRGLVLGVLSQAVSTMKNWLEPARRLIEAPMTFVAQMRRTTNHPTR